MGCIFPFVAVVLSCKFVRLLFSELFVASATDVVLTAGYRGTFVSEPIFAKITKLSAQQTMKQAADAIIEGLKCIGFLFFFGILSAFSIQLSGVLTLLS